jgi:hypothetical protein
MTSTLTEWPIGVTKASEVASATPIARLRGSTPSWPAAWIASGTSSAATAGPPSTWVSSAASPVSPANSANGP